MKKYLWGLIALFAMSCASVSQNEFTITGTVQNLDCGMVKIIDEDQKIIDSLSFDNGNFIAKGHVDQPRFVYIFISDKLGNNCTFSKLLIENKNLQMQVDASERKATFIGASLHEEYMDYVKYLLTIPEQKVVQELYNDLSIASANEQVKRKEEIMQELSVMRDSVISILMKYKQDAGRSQAAAALVYDQTSIHGIDEKKFAISKFDPTFTDSYYLNKLRQEVEKGTPQTKDSHNAENSLNYWGTYKGRIPAADCPGINVSLIVKQDKTFCLTYDYIDRDNTFISQGTYQIKGNYLITIGEKNDSTFYKVEENQLRILDGQRQIIRGNLEDMFILKKENN